MKAKAQLNVKSYSLKDLADELRVMAEDLKSRAEELESNGETLLARAARFYAEYLEGAAKELEQE